MPAAPPRDAPRDTRRFRHLVESAPDYLFETDASGRVVYANPAAQRAFGDGDGRSLQALVPPSARGEAAAFFARLLDGRDAEASAELPVVRHDGATVWVQVRAWPLHDDAGFVTGIQAVAREVTERREAVADATWLADRLRLLYTVTAPSGEPFAERLNRALALTTELLGLSLGVLAHVEGDTYTVAACYDVTGGLQAGDAFSLADTYCSIALEQGDVLAIDHMARSAYRAHPCYGAFGLEAYLGVPVTVDGAPYGTLCFSSADPHTFTESDRDLLRLLALWVSGALAEEARDRALEESGRRFRVLSEATFEGLAFSRHGIVLDANEQFARLIGLDSAAQAVGVSAIDMVPPEYAEKVREMNGQNRPEAYEVELVRADGSRFWGELQGRSLPYYNGAEVRVTAVRDVSQRKEAERQLRFQADVLAHVSDAVIALDLEGRVVYWNAASERLHGLPAVAVLGRPLSAVVHYALPGPVTASATGGAPADALPQAGEAGDLILEREDGRRVVFATSSVLRGERGEEVGLLAVARDVTAQREAEARLRRQATHDTLTGLLNRAQFRARISDAFNLYYTDRSAAFAVLFVDLDGFKHVNDSLGHEAGDRLLVELAGRMRHALREEDELARLGGDEFGVLLYSADPAEPPAVAARLLAAINAPLQLHGRTVAPGASVGLVHVNSRYARVDDAPAALLRDADTAMYAAKRSGRGRIVAFTPEMHAAADERFRLGEDLRGAAARGELVALYQPIVELATGNVAGFEALIRWQHPEHGLMAPDRFIPLAEELGLVADLDLWILETACREIGGWGEAAAHLHVAVNCSEQTYLHTDLAAHAAAQLATCGLSPRQLVLELTERALVNDLALTNQSLAHVLAHEVRLCVDDFGTGTSSLSLLHALPLDILKVDRSFVWAMGSSDRSRAVVSTIVHLAHDLGMDVVAEGIETLEHAEALRELNCRYGQGFYYSRPVPLDVARTLLDGPLGADNAL